MHETLQNAHPDRQGYVLIACDAAKAGDRAEKMSAPKAPATIQDALMPTARTSLGQPAPLTANALATCGCCIRQPRLAPVSTSHKLGFISATKSACRSCAGDRGTFHKTKLCRFSQMGHCASDI